MSARRPAAMLAFAPERNPDTLPPEQHARLESLVTLLGPQPVQDFAHADARAHLSEVEVLITGWGAPPVTGEVLGAMPRLRLIAHLAGSVKAIVDRSAFERGIEFLHAGLLARLDQSAPGSSDDRSKPRRSHGDRMTFGTPACPRG